MQDETPQTARDVAGRLDLKRSGRGWRGNCPACGYAGTFSVREGQGGRALYWCASCQDRDGLSRAIGGGTVAKLPPIDRAGEAEAKARKQGRALALWNNAVPIEGTRVALYLTRRGLASLIGSPVLRYRAMTSHPAGGGTYPAMVALVTDAADNPMAVHRTYLAPDGQKADVNPVKASVGPIWGGAIRLSPHDPDKPLIIGEGVETAASAGVLFGWPAWSAVSCGNMGRGLVLPREVRRVCIAADPGEPGRKAAREAWFRWKAEGRHVTIVTPTGAGDFNDILCLEASHVG